MRVAIYGVVLVWLVSGCGKKSRGTEERASASSATTSAVSAPPPPATSVAPVPEPPPMLAHLAPAWGDHGRLPPKVGLPLGERIPDVAGIDTDGKSFRLLDAAKQRSPLVLIFYRGGFCGFAAYFLRSLALQSQAFRDVGATLVMITPDSVDNVRLTKAAHQLDWPMLSDADLTITKAFHLEHTIDDKDIADAAKFKMELPVSANGGKVTLTNPAVVVVDPNGFVRFAHAETRADKLLAYSQILDGIKQAQIQK
jgi:peroxiredoxin